MLLWTLSDMASYKQISAVTSPGIYGLRKKKKNQKNPVSPTIYINFQLNNKKVVSLMGFV